MKVWYTLEKANGKWTVWENREHLFKHHGGGGCRGIYRSENKKDCIKFCEDNKIKIKKGV